MAHPHPTRKSKQECVGLLTAIAAHSRSENEQVLCYDPFPSLGHKDSYGQRNQRRYLFALPLTCPWQPASGKAHKNQGGKKVPRFAQELSLRVACFSLYRQGFALSLSLRASYSSGDSGAYGGAERTAELQIETDIRAGASRRIKKLNGLWQLILRGSLLEQEMCSSWQITVSSYH